MEVKVKPEFVAHHNRASLHFERSVPSLHVKRGQEHHGVSKHMTREPCSDML